MVCSSAGRRRQRFSRAGSNKGAARLRHLSRRSPSRNRERTGWSAYAVAAFQHGRPEQVVKCIDVFAGYAVQFGVGVFFQYSSKTGRVTALIAM